MMNIWDRYPKGTTSATLIQERVEAARIERENRLMKQYGTIDPVLIRKFHEEEKKN